MSEASSPLESDRLYRRCDPDSFDFETTDELDDPREIVGQTRASSAVRFGIGVGSDGFNIFALGPEEADKDVLVRHHLEERAREEDVPRDICYVNNFEDSREPRLLRLPPGTAHDLAQDLDQVLQELRPTLGAAFESEEYQTRRQTLEEEAGGEQQEAFERLQEQAQERGLALLRTPSGFVFAPVKDGEVVSPDEIGELPDDEEERLRGAIQELQKELQGILRQMPQRQRKVRERVRELNREIARYAAQDLFSELRESYADYPGVLEHLDAVEENIVQSVRSLLGQDREGGNLAELFGGSLPGVLEDPELRRYRVNALVDHGDAEHAPVVYEDNPTHQNLVGRLEHLPLMGALVTDFSMIRPGALHRADGGYLMLDAHRVLMQPFAWEGLKRALQSGEVRIESPREALGLVSTVSLEPEPLPLDVKVVLLGERLLYYLLCEYDPDFENLFKVAADFSEQMDRSPEAERLYARLVAGLVRQEELRPFHRDAVARVVEQAAREAEDAEKLSVRTRTVVDLLREADHWAGEAGAEVVGREHVQEALDQQIHRQDRIRERIHDEIRRGTIFIDTEGERVGQINGLSVLQLGGFSFGRPNRITARARLGKGEVVDIEREVEMSGPIHSKGVLILQGYLGARFASDRPLSLSASLVFEQSYAGVEGDSASSAELYALLSAIADVPLRQDLAVTGSVNQHGEIQPIGGVNQKIEGFFDVCRARGLTGDQGVLIPAANVKHLMLRSGVVEAVEGGEFAVHPVESVDQGMALLTGLEPGERDDEGAYPEGSVNHRVERRLAELARTAQEFDAPAEEEGGE